MGGLVDSIEELRAVGARLEPIAAQGEKAEFTALERQIQEAVDLASKAWSGSWIGYHSRVYYKDLKAPPAGAAFSSEWGFMPAYSNATTGDWVEYTLDDAIQAIRSLAADPDLSEVKTLGREATEAFESARADIVSILSAVISDREDGYLSDLKSQTEKLKVLTASDVARGMQPREFMSRDRLAMGQGVQTPPHIGIFAELVEARSPVKNCRHLATIANRAAAHLERVQKRDLVGANVQGHRIFIGHGRSPEWLKLKDFLQDRLGLEWDEFNRVPVAGKANLQRLSEMLGEAGSSIPKML